MRKKTVVSLLVFIFIIFLAASAIAEEKEKKNIPKMETKFYLQGSYFGNSNNPPSGRNDFRAFDQRANFLGLDLVEALAYKDATRDSRLGFRVKVTGGETARFIHAKGLGNPDESVDLTEVNLTYAFGDGRLKLLAGKMLTFIGAEVLEVVDNPNYSHSFLYTFAEPISHTGLKLSYDFSDKVNAGIHYINGWDNFADNNQAKSLGFSLGINPSDKISTSFNFINGPERDSNTGDNRFLFDWVGTVKPFKNFTFVLNYDYGKEQNALAVGQNARWDGFAGIVKYDFTDRLSLAVRGESFNDQDGYRTGVPQSLNEWTFSPQIKIGSNTVLRPEYRLDKSNVNSFNGGAAKTQSTVGLGVMVTF
jgi:hypothetical protein